MTKTSNIPLPPPVVQEELPILKYIGIIIALIAIVVCYFLYKKISSMNSHTESITKLEENFSKYIKEQNEINTMYTKKFNLVGSEFNNIQNIFNENMQEISKMVNNENHKKNEKDSFIISKEEKNENKEEIDDVVKIKQPEQRQMMPTSVFQTSLPVDNNNNNSSNTLQPPIPTHNKKSEIINDKLPVLNESNVKKVVTISSNEEVFLEEDSSDNEN